MKQRLLFVDDDPSVIRTVERLLENEPIEFYGYQSPLKALEAIALVAPQVILSKQIMPEMDGVPFLGATRLLLPDSVRMVLSGYSMPPYAEGAMLKGIVSKFLPKPLGDITLLQEIRNAFLKYVSANAPVTVRCSICGINYSTESMYAHSSFRLCVHCKEKLAPISNEMPRGLAGYLKKTAR